MIHRGALEETLNQSCTHSSRSDTILQALSRKIVNDSGSIMSVAAFVKQHVINAVEKNLNRELPLTKEIPSPPVRFTLSTTCIILDKESKASRTPRQQHDRKDLG